MTDMMFLCCREVNHLLGFLSIISKREGCLAGKIDGGFDQVLCQLHPSFSGQLLGAVRHSLQRQAICCVWKHRLHLETDT